MTLQQFPDSLIESFVLPHIPSHSSCRSSLLTSSIYLVAKIAPSNSKIAPTNVRVFDGQELSELTTVIIDGGFIATDSTRARDFYGNGGVLLPGLTDVHVHLENSGHLKQLSKYGVTTALDMACWPPARVKSLKGHIGVTDILSAGSSASAPGSTHSHIPNFPKHSLLENASQAAQFVPDRVAEGSDYIKIISDIRGPDQSTVNALVIASHKHN